MGYIKMSLRVTEQDRRRVKNTTLVFGIIFIVCAVLAGLFIAIMPRTKQLKAIGPNAEPITALVLSHDGETYFAQSKNWLCEYDAFTDELLSEFNLTDSIKQKVEQTGGNVVKNSFAQLRVSSFAAESGNYFIVTDSNGNMFKLEKNEQGKLEVSDDYYLIEYYEGEKYNPKVSKGLDFLIGTNRMFSLILENNFFYVEEYDMANLAGGVLKSKFLWDIGLDEGDGYRKLEAVKSNAGVLAFYAHENYLIFIKNGGSIIRLSTDLIDTNYGDGDIDFFEDAKLASERGEEAEAEYVRVYNQTYIDYIVDDLVNFSTKKQLYASSNGADVAVTADDIRAIGNEYKAQNFTSKVTLEKKTTDDQTLVELSKLLDIYKKSAISSYAKSKTAAEKEAKTNAEEATKVELDWCKGYNPNVMSMYVKEEYLDKTCYASYIPGESVINGMQYSKKNKALYYTNASDGYLYVVKTSDLANLESGSFVSSVAKRIDNIHCGKGQAFSNFGNGLSYNEFANTLYLKFANERQLTIVDINDMSNYKEVAKFTGAFDMFSLAGDKDNKVTQVIHQVTKVNNKGVEQALLYICSYEPERFANKPLITTLFVIFLAIATVTFFISLWLMLSARTEKGVKKVVFIAKDTKKNKFVYLALVPFVVMLLMFCYYEAIGAIAMSFFDYTEKKPAWIWNNFANYIKIFNNKMFLPSALNMLFFLAADLILSIIPPIIFAILLILIRNQVTSSWIRSLMFIPGIIPSIAGMLIWRVGIYGDEGLLNQMVMACGGQPVNWLLNKDYARWSLIFMGFPFVGGYLIFYGGMMNIPTEYHEAGKLEGLGTIKRFLKIDIPLIMPQIKYIFITTFIGSVQNFERTHILNSTVVTTPVQTMYTMMTFEKDYGMSSAYATLIFIFLFAAVATNFKMQKQDAMGADL